MNRRDFLKSNVKSLFKTVTILVQDHFDTARKHVRPPGALNESSFLLTCSRCGDCSISCPQGIIMTLDTGSGAAVGTPYLNLEANPCTMCMKCVDACRDGALELKNGRKPKIGRAVVIRNNCIAERQTICDYCVRSCPQPGALSFVDGRLQVDSDLCNGCGHCASSCIAEYRAIYIEPV